MTDEPAGSRLVTLLGTGLGRVRVAQESNTVTTAEVSR